MVANMAYVWSFTSGPDSSMQTDSNHPPEKLLQQPQNFQQNPSATVLAAVQELQKHVTCFWAGDEVVAAQWLTNFQRSEAAWEVSVEVLRPGPLPSCDEELMQEFCAQTLARLSRSFGSQRSASVQHTCVEQLQTLLQAHSMGQRGIWKQLALALTSVRLWTGKWAWPSNGDLELPQEVRAELLSLPAELLFCDRGLPLDESKLRQVAAQALLQGCWTAFEELLRPGSQDAASVRTVASWLRALRKALRWVPLWDATQPIQSLASFGPQLLEKAASLPGDSAEVALQLTRWQQIVCNDDMAIMLDPVLSSIFCSLGPEESQRLLPLMCELSAGIWPRAAAGDIILDWHGLGEAAKEMLRLALKARIEQAPGEEDENEDDDEDGTGGVGADVEATLGVWERFAVTMSEGTQAAAATLLEEDDDPGAPRPEKRSRREAEQNWKPSTEKIAQCENILVLFQMFMQGLLEMLRISSDPLDLEALKLLQRLRASARTSLAAWVKLIRQIPTWEETAFQPLHLAIFSVTSGTEETLDDATWRDVEAALWIGSVLAEEASKHGEGLAAEAALAVWELREPLSQALEPWRTWLLHSATSFAPAMPRERVPNYIEWMLANPPSSSFALEVLELTELPFMQNLRTLCERLPQGSPHIGLCDRLVLLVFVERPPKALHARVVEVKAAVLEAMRFAAGSDHAVLCQGLRQGLLPSLTQAAEQEAAQALADPSNKERPWTAARTLFALLRAALPLPEQQKLSRAAGDGQGTATAASLALWKDCWRYIEAAMTTWPQTESSEEPSKSAVAALVAAASALPGLLPDIVNLLAASVAKYDMPDIEFDALRTIISTVSCPPLDPASCAEVLCAAVASAAEAELRNEEDLTESPSTLAAFFQLLAEAIRPSPLGTAGAGPCAGQLRPRLMARTDLINSSLSVAVQSLQNCTSEAAVIAILRFLGNFVGTDKLAGTPLEQLKGSSLPLTAPVLQALSTLPQLQEMEEGLIAAAELLLRLFLALSSEDASNLLVLASTEAGLAPGSRDQLQRLLSTRSSFQNQTDWLEDFQQVVYQLQREHAKVKH